MKFANSKRVIFALTVTILYSHFQLRKQIASNLNIGGNSKRNIVIRVTRFGKLIIGGGNVRRFFPGLFVAGRSVAG